MDAGDRENVTFRVLAHSWLLLSMSDVQDYRVGFGLGFLFGPYPKTFCPLFAFGDETCH